jgi:hypothetical protein
MILGLFAGLVLGAMLASAIFIYVNRTSTIPPLLDSDFQAAMARWEKNGPPSYNLDLTLTVDKPEPIHVEVRAGQVTRMTRDGRQPSQKRTWDAWSVPGQFDTIERELEMARDPATGFGVRGGRGVLRAQFDQRLGYPRRYWRIVLGAPRDLQLQWTIDRFETVNNGK